MLDDMIARLDPGKQTSDHVGSLASAHQTGEANPSIAVVLGPLDSVPGQLKRSEQEVFEDQAKKWLFVQTSDDSIRLSTGGGDTAIDREGLRLCFLFAHRRR